METFPFSKLLLLLGETILVRGETMWAKLVMGETRYIPRRPTSKTRILGGPLPSHVVPSISHFVPAKVSGHFVPWPIRSKSLRSIR